MTTQRYPGTGTLLHDSPSLQTSPYALAHLRACVEAGDPALVAEALAAVPEWVSFYDVRTVLAQGGYRLSMAPTPTDADRPRERRRAGD